MTKRSGGQLVVIWSALVTSFDAARHPSVYDGKTESPSRHRMKKTTQ